jgi:histidinol-phosphatase (PHP family)
LEEAYSQLPMDNDKGSVSMLDGHIHIERGEYTLTWINQFIHKAIERQIDEIWLLEHCYRFEEFVPMYASVCTYSEYIDTWFHKKAGVLRLESYLSLIRQIREYQLPIKFKFGLEICYFKEFEDFVAELTKEKGFDFLLGSVHFVDHFAFDHKAEHWNGIDVDQVYQRYFETAVSLAQCGIYDGIAHPDSIKLFGHKPSYSLTEYYESLARELSRSDMYAEQNSGVLRRCPDTATLGMEEEMLKIMKKHKVRIVTASDAHCPEDVGDRILELNNSL